MSLICAEQSRAITQQWQCPVPGCERHYRRECKPKCPDHGVLMKAKR